MKHVVLANSIKHLPAKRLALILLAATLTSCATTGGSGGGGNTGMISNDAAAKIGKAVLITAVDAKCRTQIKTYKQWQSISNLLSKDRQAALESQVCGCASTEAVNSTSLTDLVLVANPSTRQVAVANIAQRTIVSCFSKLR